MNDIYSVSDLNKFAESIRKNAALSFTESYDENLDDFISITQMKNLITTNAIGTDEDGNLLIDEASYNKTFDEVSIWLHNVGLAKLAAAGRVECAWDSKLNEMTFWLPSSELTLKSEDDAPKPKRKSIRRNKKNKE
ncbi:hypothetical protein EBZ38_17295 [bacterium]|nr:hypothetical protein [bacterium]NDD86017.1 hypothetical protein [bacterium]